VQCPYCNAKGLASTLRLPVGGGDPTFQALIHSNVKPKDATASAIDPAPKIARDEPPDESLAAWFWAGLLAGAASDPLLCVLVGAAEVLLDDRAVKRALEL
jgi:hypothetical protein